MLVLYNFGRKINKSIFVLIIIGTTLATITVSNTSVVFAETIVRTADDDKIKSGDGNDVIEGRGGDDSIRSGDGTDTKEGNENDDKINSGDGRDTNGGGQGDDKIKSGDGMIPFLEELGMIV